MRLILMGTGPFAVPTFDWLVRSDHEIVAIVTRPVPPSRGAWQRAGKSSARAFWRWR